MACNSPISAWELAEGGITFTQRGNIVREIKIECRQCLGCRLGISLDWKQRCLGEARMHGGRNVAITLTYDEEHYPKRGMLVYRDFQLFMKRLRQEIAPQKVRFYMGGEYGDNMQNPHYHAILFGYEFSDVKPWKKAKDGSPLGRSALLERLWPYGFSLIGAVSPKSIGYITYYIVNKKIGALAMSHYRRVDDDGVFYLPPEFNQMSRMPGIGATYFDKYWRDLYGSDGKSAMIVNGQETCPPKYFDARYKRLNEKGFQLVQERREEFAVAHAADGTWQRLEVREEVQAARRKFFNQR